MIVNEYVKKISAELLKKNREYQSILDEAEKKIESETNEAKKEFWTLLENDFNTWDGSRAGCENYGSIALNKQVSESQQKIKAAIKAAIEAKKLSQKSTK